MGNVEIRVFEHVGATFPKALLMERANGEALKLDRIDHFPRFDLSIHRALNCGLDAIKRDVVHVLVLRVEELWARLLEVRIEFVLDTAIDIEVELTRVTVGGLDALPTVENLLPLRVREICTQGVEVCLGHTREFHWVLH